MKHLILITGAVAAAGFAAPRLATGALATKYRAGEAVRVELATTASIATTSMEMERDGEPVEGRFGAGGPTETTRRVVHVDTVVAAEDGAPAVVRRAFEEVGGKTTGTRRDETFERELESPFGGVTLELKLADGEVEVEVVEGRAPDHEGALEGHLLALGLDALLPAGDVEIGAEWELGAEAVRRAIGADVRAALFPPPAPADGGARGGGEGGGRRGGGFGGGDQGAQVLALAEWKGTAVLASIEAVEDGPELATIELELEADGELPEREFGGGFGGGGGGNAAPDAPRFLATTFEVELEGTLVFDLSAGRPASLELEGTVSISTETERETPDGGTFRMSREQSGTISITTTISAAEAEESASGR